MKVKVIEETKKVGYDGEYRLIVPDHSAGKPNRYTVYAIEPHPNYRSYDLMKIIGRELTLKMARKVANQKKASKD